VQHGLVKVSYATRKACQFWLFILTRNEVEEANKKVVKVLEWKMVQPVLQSIFLKTECWHK